MNKGRVEAGFLHLQPNQEDRDKLYFLKSELESFHDLTTHVDNFILEVSRLYSPKFTQNPSSNEFQERR